MHTIYIIATMFVIPAICITIEYIRKQKQDILTLCCKWFVFWAVGVRGITAGCMQAFNPVYTAELLQITTGNYIAIQELGCCNISFGVLGILSLFLQNYRKPAALSYAVFLLGASVIHISRLSIIGFDEFMSLSGDLFVVAIAIIVFITEKKKIKKD